MWDMSDRVLGIATHVMVMAIVIAVILLFMGIIILILFHLCITGGLFRSEFGNNATIDRGSLGSSSMSRDDVEKLPCFDYNENKEKKGSSHVDCAICLEDFKVGEKCRLLPLCKHSFHANCVDSWLLITPICPVCRTCADSWRGCGTVSGEEDGNRGGVVIELRESRIAEIEQLTDGDNELSERAESSHLGEVVIELGDGETIESRELSENAELEVSEVPKIEDLSDIGGVLKDNQRVES